MIGAVIEKSRCYTELNVFKEAPTKVQKFYWEIKQKPQNYYITAYKHESGIHKVRNKESK